MVPHPDADRPNRTLLVVDDDEHNRLILRHFLAHARWIVDEAEDGPEALRKIGERSYDVVFLDIEMPIMNGLEVAARIRAGNPDPRPLLVGLSSHDDAETRARALERGCDRYLTKPVSRQTLVDLVLGASGPVIARTPTIDPDVMALLPAFLKKQEDEIRNFEAAIAVGDAEALRRASHRMRGSAALYGLAAVSAVCGQMEELASQGRVADAADRLPELVKALRNVQGQLG